MTFYSHWMKACPHSCGRLNPEIIFSAYSLFPRSARCPMTLWRSLARARFALLSSCPPAAVLGQLWAQQQQAVTGCLVPQSSGLRRPAHRCPALSWHGALVGTDRGRGAQCSGRHQLAPAFLSTSECICPSRRPQEAQPGKCLCFLREWHYSEKIRMRDVPISKHHRARGRLVDRSRGRRRQPGLGRAKLARGGALRGVPPFMSEPQPPPTAGGGEPDLASAIAVRIPPLVRGLRHVDAGCTGCANPVCGATHRLLAKVSTHDCGQRSGCNFCHLWRVCVASYGEGGTRGAQGASAAAVAS